MMTCLSNLRIRDKQDLEERKDKMFGIVQRFMICLLLLKGGLEEVDVVHGGS